MKINSRDRALLGVVAALTLCAAFYVLALKPERSQAAHLQGKIAAANETLAGAQQSEAQGQAAEENLRRTQASWAAAQHAVPKVADIPALLKLLQRTTAAAHVSMQSISLTGSGSSSAAIAGTSTTEDGATPIPVSLTFSGGYQALNRLVDRLGTFVTVSHEHLRAPGPLVGISSVTVSPAGSGSDPSSLSIQVTASIYQHSAASTVLGGTTGGS